MRTIKKEEVVLIVEDRNDELTGCTYSSLEWLRAPDAPVVSAGEDGTFYEQQIIGGAVIEHEGIRYMYCMSGVKGTEEGAAERVIGLCTSSDLHHWTVHPEPLIASGLLGVKGENLYPNACIRTEDGKFVLFFSAQAFPEWIGVYAMISDSPADRYDNRWVGWPRMVIADGKGYVFHSASGTKVHVGLRTIEIDRLTDWDNEGGFKENLL